MSHLFDFFVLLPAIIAPVLLILFTGFGKKAGSPALIFAIAGIWWSLFSGFGVLFYTPVALVLFAVSYLAEKRGSPLMKRTTDFLVGIPVFAFLLFLFMTKMTR